jgi:plastocyanin
MSVTRRILALLTLLVLVVAACGGDDDDAATTAAGSGAADGGDEVQASLAGFAFDPATVTVAAGGTVTWTNADNTAHTVTAGAPGEPTDEFETLSLDPEASGSLTFPDAGSFAFFCEIHPAMVVTVDVG